MTVGSTRGGGPAAAEGSDYQHRVAAWLAVHILAERNAQPPFGLAVDTTLESLACETRQPTDDILARTSGDGHIFVQATTTITVACGGDSKLASVVDQFVRQYIVGRQDATTGSSPGSPSPDRGSASRPIT